MQEIALQLRYLSIERVTLYRRKCAKKNQVETTYSLLIELYKIESGLSSVQSLSRVRLFVTP